LASQFDLDIVLIGFDSFRHPPGKLLLGVFPVNLFGQITRSRFFGIDAKQSHALANEYIEPQIDKNVDGITVNDF
jgi:hypothetical protein